MNVLNLRGDQMLNIAYIGNGKSTNRYHVPFALKNGRFNIKTIFSRHNDSPWPKLAQVTYTNNLDDIFNDQELDLVVVTTPSAFHYDYAKKCLEHNKNVLVEKPFTQTVAQAQELFDLAKQKGLFIQAYQNRRFDSDFLTVQKVIESNKLGQLIEVENNYDYFRPEVPANQQSLTWENSFLYTHACHTVDQIISYFGKPHKVSYDVRQILGKGRMNDLFDLDFYYDNPLKVSIKSSYFRLTKRPSFALYGTKGSFIKVTEDKQEQDLKHFYLPSPDHPDFGLDKPEDYGILTYMDADNHYHQEKITTVSGDYSRFYEGIYQSLVNHRPKLVSDEQTLAQIEILAKGYSLLQ